MLPAPDADAVDEVLADCEAEIWDDGLVGSVLDVAAVLEAVAAALLLGGHQEERAERLRDMVMAPGLAPFTAANGVPAKTGGFLHRRSARWAAPGSPCRADSA